MSVFWMQTTRAVSYTHLDVYKRQDVVFGGEGSDYIETNLGSDIYASGDGGKDVVVFTSALGQGRPVSDYGVSSGVAHGFGGASGGAGDDVVWGFDLLGFLDGGADNDLVDGSTARAFQVDSFGATFEVAGGVRIYGGSGRDILVGGSQPNVFWGDHSPTYDPRLAVLADAAAAAAQTDAWKAAKLWIQTAGANLLVFLLYTSRCV